MLWLGIVKITYWVHNNNLLMKSIPIQYRHGYPNPDSDNTTGCATSTVTPLLQ